MDEKWIVLIGIIILLVVGFFVFTSFMNQGTEFKVVDAKFKVHDGYHVGDSKKKMANLTDGKKNICIREYDDKNIKKHIYVKHKHQRIARPYPEGEFVCGHSYNGDEQGHRGTETPCRESPYWSSCQWTHPS